MYNAEKNATNKQSHSITLNMRKEMSISGVKEVESFDDISIVLITVCGEMTVEGESLKVGSLDNDSGIVSLEGKINSIYYTDKSNGEKKGFISKLFG